VSGNVRDRAFAIAAICTRQEFQPEDASPSNVRRFDEFDGLKHQDRVKDQTINANNAALALIGRPKTARESRTHLRVPRVGEGTFDNQRLSVPASRSSVGTGTGQEFSFDRPVRNGGTSSVLLMVSWNAHMHQQLASPSRFARFWRSSRWRHQPLTLHAATSFFGVLAN
jgi:hypothetical protein